MRTLIALGLTCLAGAASAQGFYDAPPSTDRALAAAPYREMAGCAVKLNKTSADEILRDAPGSDREKRKIDSYFDKYFCKELTHYTEASREQRLVAIANRRAFIAEALLKARFPDFSSRPAPTVTRPARAVAPMGGSAADNAAMVRGIAQCLIASDWRGVTTVLGAQYATEAESRALEALEPQMRGCVTPEFDKRIHGLYLRGALAEAVYGALRGGAA